jgi:hypothetical protein
LKDVSSAESTIQRQIVRSELKEKITLICKNQKHYFEKMLNDNATKAVIVLVNAIVAVLFKNIGL